MTIILSKSLNIMSERGEDEDSIFKPLPAKLQKIVDKEEKDWQLRADYENSYTS